MVLAKDVAALQQSRSIEARQSYRLRIGCGHSSDRALANRSRRPPRRRRECRCAEWHRLALFDCGKSPCVDYRLRLEWNPKADQPIEEGEFLHEFHELGGAAPSSRGTPRHFSARSLHGPSLVYARAPITHPQAHSAGPARADHASLLTHEFGDRAPGRAGEIRAVGLACWTRQQRRVHAAVDALAHHVRLREQAAPYAEQSLRALAIASGCAG